MKLSDNIRYLKGIGEKRAELFARLGINTIGDLLAYFPRGYEDRSSVTKISDVSEGDVVCVKGMVAGGVRRFRSARRMQVVQTAVSDGSGMLKLVWFNAPYVERTLSQGGEFIFCGKVVQSGFAYEMINPVIDREGGGKTGKIIPIYSTVNALPQRNIREAVENAWRVVDEPLVNIIPSETEQRYNLLDVQSAVQNIHFPRDFEIFSRARRRLVFEEFLILQTGILLSAVPKEEGHATAVNDVRAVRTFAAGLKFSLTGAQKRVINEICGDLKKTVPMNRLVQGDVGSGKTIVAAAAMFEVASCGYQAALMAPTEILAEQHFRGLKEMFEPYGVKVAFLSGGQKAKEKRESLELIRSGEAKIAVGTHALLTENVDFENLVLAVTDEQHRFGVRQRAALSDKGANIHTLVMTATPIPRTLSLVLYGDLDVSVIDELPPGRKRVATYTANEKMRRRVELMVEKELESGGQAYIVCPLVEESDVLDAKSAVEYAEHLKKGILGKFNIDIIHGKMKAAEKDEVMHRFIRGETQILVSTTVIEVGVDVPNASIMIVESAERFGLSQLHQLRGRVGRGERRSYCILFCENTGGVAGERMKIMCETDDGFEISEKDLQIRGPGEMFGTRQHGLPNMKIANFYTDMDVLKEAQTAAREILDADPELKEHPALREKVEEKFAETVLN